MKTTIEIADSLLRRAKETAYREKTTLRSLVEEGLGAVLQNHARRPKKFKYQPVTFHGGSHHPPPDLNWEKIRDLVYDEPRLRP